jgi:hypothetical protein
VAKRLMPPNKFIRCIRVTIPETCFFQGGDPKFIVFTAKVCNIQVTFLGKRRKKGFPGIEVPKIEVELPLNPEILQRKETQSPDE